MTEVHSEKQIMTYSDKDIDAMAAWLRSLYIVDEVGSDNPRAKEAADMLAQLKIDRAFLRTEVEQLRDRNTDLMAKWGIATGRSLAAGNERDRLREKLAKCHGDLMVADQRIKELGSEVERGIEEPWEGAP